MTRALIVIMFTACSFPEPHHIGADAADAIATDTLADATADAPADAAPMVPDLSWAQWLMPDSLTPFCTNGAGSSVSCAGTNQDGEILMNIPAYTTTTDTVTDSLTGLMWQRNAPAGTYTQADAQLYCDGLSLATFSNWRLPTTIELLSIVDFGRVIPCIDSTVFGTVAISAFWTSDVYAPDNLKGWTVNFHSGNSESNLNSTSFPVRCVRKP